jgi:hypothetical protein
MVKGVGNAVVKGGQAFSVDTGTNDRHVSLSKATREVFMENIKSRGRGVVEAGKAVEFADSVFDVDTQLLVVGTVRVKLAHSGCQSLQAAIEG